MRRHVKQGLQFQTGLLRVTRVVTSESAHGTFRNNGSAMHALSVGNKFCFIDPLAARIVTRCCRVTRFSSYSRCLQMGVTCSTHGAVGDLNYVLNTVGRWWAWLGTHCWNGVPQRSAPSAVGAVCPILLPPCSLVRRRVLFR